MATVAQLAARAAAALQEQGLDYIVQLESAGAAAATGARGLFSGGVRVDINWCGLALRWRFSFSGPGTFGPEWGTAAPEIDLAVPVPEHPGAAASPVGLAKSRPASIVPAEGLCFCAWDSPRAVAPMGCLPLPGTSELEAAHCMAELQAWSVEALCEWDGRDDSSLAQLVTELVATMSSSHADFAERVLPGAAAGVKSLSSVAHHVLTVDDGARGSRVVVRSPVAFCTEPEPAVAAGQTRAAVEVTFQAKGAAAAAEGDDGVKVTARIVGPAAMPVTSAIVLPPLLVDDAGGLSGFVAAASKRVLGSWKARREFCKAIATLASGAAAAQEAAGAESVAGPGVLAWDAVDWSRVSVPVRAVEGPGAWVPLPPLLCQFAGQAADPAHGEDQPAVADPGLSADDSREAHYCVQPGAAAGSAARVAAVLTVRLSHAFPAESPAIELRSIAPSDGSARPGVVSDRDAPIGWSPDGVQPSELAIRVTLHAWTKLLPLLAATPA